MPKGFRAILPSSYLFPSLLLSSSHPFLSSFFLSFSFLADVSSQSYISLDKRLSRNVKVFYPAPPVSSTCVCSLSSFRVSYLQAFQLCQVGISLPFMCVTSETREREETRVKKTRIHTAVWGGVQVTPIQPASSSPSLMSYLGQAQILPSLGKSPPTLNTSLLGEEPAHTSGCHPSPPHPHCRQIHPQYLQSWPASSGSWGNLWLCCSHTGDRSPSNHTKRK